MDFGQVVVFVVGLTVVPGVAYAMYDRMLRHRQEMARIQLEVTTRHTAVVTGLELEVKELRERLNEQLLRMDDVTTVHQPLGQ